MSSLRKAAPRRTHRERSQLKERAHLGLLEKKKDYVLRAADFASKQKRLKAMRNKALARNPDEFYFGMINSSTKNGVHVKQQVREKYEHEHLRLLRTQDQNYVNYQLGVNRKKLQKLKDSVHIIEDAYEPEEDEVEDDGAEEDAAPVKRKGKPKHILFVEDDDEVQRFDPVAYFDTTPEFLKQRYNRKRKSNVQEVEEVDKDTIRQQKKLRRQRAATRKEIASREKREETLRQLRMEMELQKQLMGKGSKKKVGTDASGLAVFKWKAERKK
ncbi:UTP11-like, U3 small nucleolar ribonucleoprotein [Irineochytrium annulatum]|nr:UTP11-like, U3 small nucleolar ribonucleoprotein [Irineochytrium annulatum]